MTTWVAWIFALITAAIHLLVFVFEALLITRSWVHAGVFKIPAADVPPIRLWAFGVGFYNLFLGTGMIIGVVAWMAGREVAGQTLVIYLSAMLRCPEWFCSSRTGWRSAGRAAPGSQERSVRRFHR